MKFSWLETHARDAHKCKWLLQKSSAKTIARNKLCATALDHALGVFFFLAGRNFSVIARIAGCVKRRSAVMA